MMAFSAPTRCLQSTTRITCRRKPPDALEQADKARQDVLINSR